MRRWIGLLLAGLVSSFLFGDEIPSPPGSVAKVGATNVHVRCEGHGKPAVILIHGFGGYSFDWALVQPALGKETETCSYDRPGQAWSDSGPGPRGLATSARELHDLLRTVGVKGPYVLVGHSWGGLIARMFAHDYPRDVAGIVLVDAAHEDEYLWINGKIIRPRFVAEEEWTSLVHPSGSKPPQGPSSRHVVTKLNPPFDKLPPDAQRLRMWAMSLPPSFTGGDTDDIRRDFIAMHDATAQQKHPLGSIPLVVVSKTPGVDDDDDYTTEQRQWNLDLQNQLVGLSTAGVHMVAKHSGHEVQIEEPDLVIDAVHRVLTAARSAGRIAGAALK